MRQGKGLSENTIKSKFCQLQDFSVNINNKKQVFNEITSLIVDNVLAKKYNIDGYSRKTVQPYASVIRSFVSSNCSQRKYSLVRNW